MAKKKTKLIVSTQAPNETPKFVHHSKAEQPNGFAIMTPDGLRVISKPGKPKSWNEAAKEVVKEHAGAWKRLED